MCPVSGARWWAQRGPDTGVRGAPFGEAPAEGRALGQGSSSLGPHAGRGTASPGGQSQGQRLPRPARPEKPSEPPARRRTAPVHNGGGSIWQRVPPTRAASRPLRDPQTHLLQGTGISRRPPAARRRPPAQHGCRPSSRPRRPWLKDQSAGRWLAGACSEAAAPEALGVARPLFHAGSPRSRSLRPEDSRYGPGRGARPPLLRIRQRGRGETGPTPGPAARAPVPTISGPGALALRSLTLGSWPRALRSSDLRTRGQTDAWTGGRAPGLAGGGQAAEPASLAP